MQHCKKYILHAFFLIIFSSSVFANTYITHTERLPYKESHVFLKEKISTDSKHAPIIVLLNAVSIPSVDAFDVSGYSLMETLADAGYDVWGIDFINQGHADRSDDYPLSAESAVDQLKTALQYIYTKQGRQQIAILGWSWGTLVAAKYAIAHPEEVSHLILSAAMYSSPMPEPEQSMMIDGFNRLAKDQPVPWKMINDHWETMLSKPEYQRNRAAVHAAKNIYCHIEEGTDCTATRLKSQMQDLVNAWTGRPLYDAEKIVTPTLLVYGSNDYFSDKKLFEKITHASYKQEVVVNGGSHWLLYESKRNIYYNSMINFLKTHE